MGGCSPWSRQGWYLIGACGMFLLLLLLLVHWQVLPSSRTAGKDSLRYLMVLLGICASLLKLPLQHVCDLKVSSILWCRSRIASKLLLQHVRDLTLSVSFGNCRHLCSIFHAALAVCVRPGSLKYLMVLTSTCASLSKLPLQHVCDLQTKLHTLCMQP
jgi:hypothetical protein